MRLCLFISFQLFGTSNVSHQLVALRIHVVYMIEGYAQYHSHVADLRTRNFANDFK
jgi:hypothetical protein